MYPVEIFNYVSLFSRTWNTKTSSIATFSIGYLEVRLQLYLTQP
jgi:hypothetical protein